MLHYRHLQAADWEQVLSPNADRSPAGGAAMTACLEDLKPAALGQELVDREAVLKSVDQFRLLGVQHNKEF